MVNGPLIDPYADNTKKVNADANKAVGDAVNNAVTGAVTSSLQSMFGVTPARAGKAIHQFLVSTAGVGLILLGFVMIVSGTKTARGLADAVVSTVKEGATVAAV